MDRRPLVGGNWKMNLDSASIAELASAVSIGVENHPDVDVAIFPPAPYLDAVVKVASGHRILVGGQDVSAHDVGAYTGQTSAGMIRDLGCSITLVGHSERRHGLGESGELLAEKVAAGVRAGLRILFCVGETLPQREAGTTFETVIEQMRVGLSQLEQPQLDQVDLAYEPVWAIGTGRNAGPAEAQEVHQALREDIAARYDARSASRMRILYGGSMKPANAAELMACADVDGGLIGGASLKAASFLEIVRAADPQEHA